jgi:hypothetical protein
LRFSVCVDDKNVLGVEYTVPIHVCLRDTVMWRQGDVLIAEAGAIPRGAIRRPNCVLAEGELTGHSHRIDQPGVAELYECNGMLYLQVLAGEAKVVHQEHGPITLPHGVYAVWQQREYTPQSIRPMTD